MAAPVPPEFVPVDVLPPQPRDGRAANRAQTANEDPGNVGNSPRWTGFYHPAAGALIIGIDLLGWAPDMLSGFVAVPLVCLLTFLVTFPLVFLIQRRWCDNSVNASFGKALLGAVAAGLPFSITGTLLGAAILTAAGLPRNPGDVVRHLLGRR